MVLSALISGGAGAAAGEGAGAWAIVPPAGGAVPFPASSSFSAAFSAAVSLLSASDAAFASLTWFSNWSMRLLSASISSSTVGCNCGLAAVVAACVVVASAAEGGSDLAVSSVWLGAVAATCAVQAQQIPAAITASVVAFQRTILIFTSRFSREIN